MPNLSQILSYSRHHNVLHHQWDFSLGNRRKHSFWVSSLLGLEADALGALRHYPSLMSGVVYSVLGSPEPSGPPEQHSAGLLQLQGLLGHSILGLPEPLCLLGQQTLSFLELLTPWGTLLSGSSEPSHPPGYHSVDSILKLTRALLAHWGSTKIFPAYRG